MYKKHGKTKTPEYRTWVVMRARCSPRNSASRNYYYRGIAVCERWDSFENFLSDMGERPSLKHSIDRIDPNGNYEPSNCRWATTMEQATNRRNTRIIEHQGLRMSVSQWARHLNIERSVIYDRLDKGHPVEEALSPIHLKSTTKRVAQELRRAETGYLS